MAPVIRDPRSSSHGRGYTLIELLFTVSLIVILAGIATPQFVTTIDRSRAWAATRYLAARMARARAQAVMRSAHVALRFTQDGSGIAFQMFVDNNHNGVRTRDIAANIDRPLERPVRLFDLFPGVDIAVSGDDGMTDAVRIGSSNLLSFTPIGTATSGTIFVRGREGSQLAVRVLGATGRARVLRYVPRSREWVESF